MISTLRRRFCSSSTVKFLASSSQIGLKMETKTARRPEGVIQNWDLTQLGAKDIEKKCDESIQGLKQLAEKAATAETLSYGTVLEPILEALRLYEQRGIHGAVFFISTYFGDVPGLKDAAVSAKKKVDAELLEMQMRTDIHNNLVKYRESLEKDSKKEISDEVKKCLDEFILEGQRNGLQLDETTRIRVKELKNKINTLSLQYRKNLGDENTILLVTTEELPGLDSEFINSLEKDPDSGKLKLTLKYPHYLPVMSRCQNPELRRKLEFAYNTRCVEENSKILEEVVQLRAEAAKLLGYPSHAAFNLELSMVKNPQTVDAFIKDIVQKFTPVWKKDHEVLLEAKKAECEKLGLEYDGKINMWDFSHYLTLVKEKKYSLNQEELKEYFPMEVVTKGLLEIYQQLLGLTFKHLPDAEKWHAEVDVYQVNDTTSGKLLGYFYLDLFPREGKYGHACCEPSQQGCLDENGVKQASVVVLICNFPRATANSPALLMHDDVETFFHEFGHAMHGICSQAETPLYFGTYVQPDFIEAPSQMLENWCFEKESLQKMSAHYKTGAPIPDEMLEKLVESRNGNIGAYVLRQMVYALTDQRIHNAGAGRCDSRQVYCDTLKELMGLDATPGTNAMSSFLHMVNEYDAKYYGYMWSEVYSSDMFETVFKKQGVLNPAAGQLYRECILEPGGSKDGMTMLKNFLGREPSSDAFLRIKGIQL